MNFPLESNNASLSPALSLTIIFPSFKRIKSVGLSNPLRGPVTRVITTPFTFASTTHAIVRNGLVPVFCDIRDDDFTIDTEKIEEYEYEFDVTEDNNGRKIYKPFQLQRL